VFSDQEQAAAAERTRERHHTILAPDAVSHVRPLLAPCFGATPRSSQQSAALLDNPVLRRNARSEHTGSGFLPPVGGAPCAPTVHYQLESGSPPRFSIRRMGSAQACEAAVIAAAVEHASFTQAPYMPMPAGAALRPVPEQPRPRPLA
jgi:hypothetical protein